jgi:putative ABC transport system permease protein
MLLLPAFYFSLGQHDTFSTLSRVREIAIRKVLGAGKRTLLAVLTYELLVLTVLASLIGIPVSIFLMTNWLNRYAFHVPLPWWIYIVVFILLIALGYLTIVRQVWRTIRLKPMRILRSE